MARLAASLYSGAMDVHDDANATPREPRLEQLLWPWRSLKHKKEAPPLGQTPLGHFVAVTFISCGVINSFVFLNDLPQIDWTYRAGLWAGTAITAMLSLPMLFLATPCGLVFLLIPKSRSLGLRLLLGSAIYFATLFGSGWAGATIRMASFSSLAERSMPLVEAVKAFEAKEGRLPERLEELVPAYISAIPGTGLAAFPRIEYSTGKEAAYWLGNPWVLDVRANRGLGSFDRFLYFPLQNYPEEFEGNGFERLGAWGYMHE
ncbi:MAG: hypothetical protein JNK74_04680 [Candidatus Hydrogenedentes bacterium]|nr:hypothetical protein [Candidatus Hydrogenedentota bacterium]